MYKNIGLKLCLHGLGAYAIHTGTTYKILPSLQTKKSRKRKNDDTRGMPTESLMKFIQRSSKHT